MLVPTVETAVGDEGKDTVEDEGGDAAGEVGEDVWSEYVNFKHKKIDAGHSLLVTPYQLDN